MTTKVLPREVMASPLARFEIDGQKDLGMFYPILDINSQVEFCRVRFIDPDGEYKSKICEEAYEQAAQLADVINIGLETLAYTQDAAGMGHGASSGQD